MSTSSRRHSKQACAARTAGGLLGVGAPVGTARLGLYLAPVALSHIFLLLSLPLLLLLCVQLYLVLWATRTKKGFRRMAMS